MASAAAVALEDSLSSLKAQMGHIFAGADGGDDAPPARTWWQEQRASLQLGYGARVALFAACTALGLLFAGLSTLFVVSPTRFAKFYTVGSLFVLCGSLFLVGPLRQLRAIAQDAQRAVAAAVYAVAVVATLWAALGVHSAALTTLFVVVQIGAALWYGLSYIPFARSCLTSTARTVLPI